MTDRVVPVNTLISDTHSDASLLLIEGGSMQLERTPSNGLENGTTYPMGVKLLVSSGEATAEAMNDR